MISRLLNSASLRSRRSPLIIFNYLQSPKFQPICAKIGLVRMVFAPQGLQDSARRFKRQEQLLKKGSPCKGVRSALVQLDDSDCRIAHTVATGLHVTSETLLKMGI